MGAALAPIADVGGVVYRYRMFGFHDFTTDPRSGRPQPHISWLAERLITWTTWANSAICMVGAVAYYLKWREMDLPTEMALASGLFASIAVWRQKRCSRINSRSIATPLPVTRRCSPSQRTDVRFRPICGHSSSVQLRRKLITHT